MPHDVTMPQLGMAQDAGKLVTWLKAPGDAVRKGDALFEVETDKATMEVEAQGDGFLTGVVAAEGEDVPVGQVIARISESADEPEEAPAPAAEASADASGGPGALPEGRAVTMPQLGMAQDAGLLVSWSVALGDKVGVDDPLFEVETDKSAMEVPAGMDGYLAATLAEAGEEVPTGEAVAIISAEPPASPVARSRAEAASAPAPAAEAPAPAPEEDRAPAKAATASARPGAAPPPGGPILASPKARRLALEQGLDLNRLAEAGHPQPYHVADLETLRAMPAPQAGSDAAPAAATQRLTAETETDGLPGFAAWAAKAHGLDEPDAILAGLAGASLDAEDTRTVAIERFGTTRAFAVPAGRRLGGVTPSEDAPHLIVRDLRGTAIRGAELGAAEAPVLTLMPRGEGLTITLEAAAGQFEPQAAIRLVSDFAGRAEDPLRHLL